MLKKKYTKKIWRVIDLVALITIIFPVQFFYSTPVYASQDSKITICHYPPGNEENPQTLEISPFALPSHVAHGDRLGRCPDTQDRKLSTFSGCKFLDKNGNGAWDNGEPTIPGWNIELKKNDETVQSITTGSDGCYSFEGVRPGTYTISEGQVEGYTQTFPESGSYQISCGFNDDKNHLDFGNKPMEHRISCGDGIKEESELCDLGEQNGVECVPGYGETCQFCSGQCELKEKKGPFCGDEVKNGEEECDREDGIGLYEQCTQECTIIQLPYCGDRIVNGDEECDDGNQKDGDSCSMQCQSEVCQGNVVLDFDTDAIEGAILKGQFIDDEYSAWGINVRSHNYNASHPQFAITFDSSNPSGGINGDAIIDIDLGTPNKMFLGPGDSEVGDGFEPSNNTSLNNVLIIPDNIVDTSPADGYVDDPNDEPAGGSLRFIFDRPYTFESVQYIDLDHSTGEVVGYSDATGSAQAFSIPVPKANGNSVQKIVGDKTTPIRFLKLRGRDSYAVDNVSLCPIVACGDGIKEGREQCDNGGQNGVECNPEYGLSCQFCTSQCTLQERKGPFCGDGVKNGEEECDGQDGVPQGSECSQTCEIQSENPRCGDGVVNGNEECDGTQNCREDCTVIPTSGSVCGVKFFDHNGNGKEDTYDENLSGWDIKISPKIECSAQDAWADSVLISSQGKRKDGSLVDSSRSNANMALGEAEQEEDVVTFFSLGFGGSVVLKFNNIIENGSGDDIKIYESTFNRSLYPLEMARVFASQDSMHWIHLGDVDNQNDTTVDLGLLPWAQYVKIVDTTDKSIHSNDADGFDLDGVSAIHCKMLGESTIKTTDANGYCFENVAFGTYHVEEVLQGGWENTTHIGKQITLSQENPNETIDFGNKQIEEVQEGVICGFKFEDTNGDGKWQSSEGERGLGGWAIQAKKGERIYETQTSNDEESLGEYCFVGLEGGSWSISEVQQEGWILTTPETINVSISQFEGSINNNFGNFKFAKISGFKFDDLDANGAIDSEEQKIPDWKIFIRKFGEATSTATTTDIVGMYRFDNLGPGRYIVTEATSSEWITTFPENGQYDITVGSGGVYENNNFLNHKKEVGGEPILHPITVCKYIDETGDGKTLASTTEDVLYMAEGGWMIKVFSDTGEPIAQANTQDGCVTFTLEDGLYKISEISKTDWIPTDAYVNQEKSQFQKDSFFDVFVSLEITSTTTATSTVDFFNRFTGSSSNGGDNDGDDDGETNPTPPQGGPAGGTGGGGGGGGGGIFGLIIHTENAFDTSLGGTYSARVTWFTNHGATSRVVYDTVSHPQLGSAPNYGYAFSTPVYDQNPKVTYHSIVIDGLVSNTIYYFRPISAASPERWGKELAVSVGTSSPGSGSGTDTSESPVSLPVSGSNSGSEIPSAAPSSQGNRESFGVGGENPNAGKILGTEFKEDANANEQAGKEENTNTNANTNTENFETKTAGEDKNQSYRFLFWILILIILAWLFFLWYNKKDDDDENMQSGSGTKSGTDIDPRNILDKIE